MPGRYGACRGERLDKQCSKCGAGEESEDKDAVAFDNKDGSWSCLDCHWEIETNNETDGSNHCLSDKNKAHFLDLSAYLDHEPGNSCSSEARLD